MTRWVETERNVWTKVRTEKKREASPQAINKKYERGEQRIVTESNREKLPNFVEALSRPGYMDLRPFYQRRPRWKPDKQSKLIESFIINIPVPPIFLYEKSYNQYEIMDGQQRVTAIRDFYQDKYALTGLEIWPELNGLKYSDLPSSIRAGIDRRSVSSIVLLRESTETEEQAALLRALVFERLNTGGVKLERQEIRNALYPSEFNEAINELSKNDLVRSAWELPPYHRDEEEDLTLPIYKKNFFKKMKEREFVLRSLALRNVKHFRRGMQGFLDLYMLHAERFSSQEIRELREIFLSGLEVAHKIYGELLFRPYDPEIGNWMKSPQMSYSDAVMVGIFRNEDKKEKLIKERNDVVSATVELFKKHGRATFTGQANTKEDVERRIDLITDMLSSI